MAMVPKKELAPTAREWRNLRNRLSATQKQFADVLGVAVRTVQYIEAAVTAPTYETQMKFNQLKSKHASRGGNR